MTLWRPFYQDGKEGSKKVSRSLFMKQLKDQKERLTRQQYKTLQGQARAGDIVGANKGLIKLMRRR